MESELSGYDEEVESDEQESDEKEEIELKLG